LEAGSVATPFEFEDISTTIEKCQRYYETSYDWEAGAYPQDNQGSYAIVSTGAFGGADDDLLVYFWWKTRKRARPSISFYAPIANPATSKIRRGSNGVVYDGTVGAVGAGNTYIAVTSGVAGVNYQFGWIASSEL